MSKTIRHDLTYDAPLDAVSAMLADPDFREEVCDRMGVLRAQATKDGKRMTIEQVQSAKGIPAFAAKFVGDEITIVQAEDWTSPDHADIKVTIPGKPGEMSGTADLEESGGTTTEHVEMTIKVRIPLVGGKIEGLIGDMLLSALKTENTVGREYLSR